MRPDFHFKGQIASKSKNRPVLVGFRHTQVSTSCSLIIVIVQLLLLLLLIIIAQLFLLIIVQFLP